MAKDKRCWSNETDWFHLNSTWLRKDSISSIWYGYEGDRVNFVVHLKTKDGESYSLCFTEEDVALNFIESELGLPDNLRQAFKDQKEGE
jgi:hypothetical protein